MSLSISGRQACRSPGDCIYWKYGRRIRGEDKRPECGKKSGFKTKPEIALAQIRAAVAGGIPTAPVLADSAYGSDTQFREGITELGWLYMMGIKSSVSVWEPGQGPLPKLAAGKGPGRPP